MSLRLSTARYAEWTRGSAFPLPSAFQPYYLLDPVRYHALLTDCAVGKRQTVGAAFRGVQGRVGRDYFRRIYPAQSSCLDYAQAAFPAYRFILPEVITEDWLAMVDWRGFHRDHTYHQPLTAYTVWQLLRDSGRQQVRIDGRPLIEHCLDFVEPLVREGYLGEFLRNAGLGEDDDFLGRNRRFRCLWRSVFREAACLAALFHDVGYPWHYVRRLGRGLSHTSPGTPAPTGAITDTIGAYGRRLALLPLRGYQTATVPPPVTWAAEQRDLLQRSLDETHGLPGALCFLSLNDRVRRYPAREVHPVRQLCVEWAAMAIVMHDMGGMYRGDPDDASTQPHPFLRLRLSLDPLSCVVALADVVEDFGRPAVTFSSSRGKVVSTTYASACKWVELEYVTTSGTLDIRYKMASLQDLGAKVPFMAKEEHEYFDPVDGYLDLSACGIQRVCMSASC